MENFTPGIKDAKIDFKFEENVMHIIIIKYYLK